MEWQGTGGTSGKNPAGTFLGGELRHSKFVSGESEKILALNNDTFQHDRADPTQRTTTFGIDTAGAWSFIIRRHAVSWFTETPSSDAGAARHDDRVYDACATLVEKGKNLWSSKF